MNNTNKENNVNKHIKHIKQLLENPTYLQEEEAKEYLGNIIKSGKMRPKLKVKYQTRGSHFPTQAITLPTECIGTHEDLDITVYGSIQKDYYEWVNFFLCVSNDGKEYIVGDFEDMVHSSSKDFYDKFIDKFEVEEWDYWDI